MNLLNPNKNKSNPDLETIIEEDDKNKSEMEHELEEYFNCLSPKASQWNSITKILRPEIRFESNRVIDEGQEFEVSPLSLKYLFNLTFNRFSLSLCFIKLYFKNKWRRSCYRLWGRSII
jgi:hypothetical protein